MPYTVPSSRQAFSPSARQPLSWARLLGFWLCPPLLPFHHPRQQLPGGPSLCCWGSLARVLLLGCPLPAQRQNPLSTEMGSSQLPDCNSGQPAVRLQWNWDSKPGRTIKEPPNPRIGEPSQQVPTTLRIVDPTVSAVEVIIRPVSVLGPLQSTPRTVSNLVSS